MKIRLECTCPACPEQYWAYTDDIEGGDRIGYIRLRWGHLTCEYLVSGKLDNEAILVYEHTFVGDEYKGMFDTEEERRDFLEKCKEALIEKHNRKGE